jgi:cobalt-zinc-cadmium efflux system outer membrane protein
MNRTWIAATLVVAGASARAAIAQEPPDRSNPAALRAPPPCAGAWDAAKVVRCALAASPEVRQAREALATIAGRRTTAEVWLPSNPVVAATIAHRRRPPPESAEALNWSVNLSQEFEIAGQRGLRVDAADAQAAAQRRRVAVAEQEVAAGALGAYYEAVAAQETLRFAEDLSRTAQALAAYAEGRAKEAVLAGVEADVARAEATRLGLVRFEAERRLAESRTALALLLEVDPTGLTLDGSLAPAPASALPPGQLEEQALRLRGEIAAAEIERQVLERRLAVVRRERVPNLTLSAFAERGEIDDRIFGFGLSVPLPLPSPVGRTRAGEIAETLAQIRAAEASTELVRRRVRLEVARAAAAYKARQGSAGLFASDLLDRARADLTALREAVASRQLSLREGLQWQRTLIELLQGDIETRLGRVLAWIDLQRVVGLPLAPPAGRAP